MDIFGWIFGRIPKRSEPEMKNPGDIDLGTPQRMVGHTGYTRHAGGGRCACCKEVFASLMPDNKCPRCSQTPFFGPNLPGSDHPDSSNK